MARKMLDCWEIMLPPLSITLLPDLDEVEWTPTGEFDLNAFVRDLPKVFPKLEPTPTEKVAQLVEEIKTEEEIIIEKRDTLIASEEYLGDLRTELEILTHEEDFPLIPVPNSKVML